MAVPPLQQPEVHPVGDGLQAGMECREVGAAEAGFDAGWQACGWIYGVPLIGEELRRVAVKSHDSAFRIRPVQTTAAAPAIGWKVRQPDGMFRWSGKAVP